MRVRFFAGLALLLAMTATAAGAAEAVTAGNCYDFKVVASGSVATAVVACGFERSA
jgi:hypothetical protein